MLTESRVAELHDRGFCVLKARLSRHLIDAAHQAFRPVFQAFLDTQRPNRGPNRHFLPMPFHPPCFAPEFFFDAAVLSVVRGTMDDRVMADQWGCDVALRGSEYQQYHIDYQRPLFAEEPELQLPVYMLIVSFGLVDITSANGPIEIAPGTHRMDRTEALRCVESGETKVQAVSLSLGDVLIRNPWAWHRGTPNTSDIPRPLATIRYVRRWYIDDSREVKPVPRAVWQSLTPAEQGVMRFPVSTTEPE